MLEAWTTKEDPLSGWPFLLQKAGASISWLVDKSTCGGYSGQTVVLFAVISAAASAIMAATCTCCLCALGLGVSKLWPSSEGTANPQPVRPYRDDASSPPRRSAASPQSTPTMEAPMVQPYPACGRDPLVRIIELARKENISTARARRTIVLDEDSDLLTPCARTRTIELAHV